VVQRSHMIYEKYKFTQRDQQKLKSVDELIGSTEAKSFETVSNFHSSLTSADDARRQSL